MSGHLDSLTIYSTRVFISCTYGGFDPVCLCRATFLARCSGVECIWFPTLKVTHITIDLVHSLRN